MIQDGQGLIHVIYSYFVDEGKSMKHAAFNEAWVQQGTELRMLCPTVPPRLVRNVVRACRSRVHTVNRKPLIADRIVGPGFRRAGAGLEGAGAGDAPVTSRARCGGGHPGSAPRPVGKDLDGGRAGDCGGTQGPRRPPMSGAASRKLGPRHGAYRSSTRSDTGTRALSVTPARDLVHVFGRTRAQAVPVVLESGSAARA